MVQTTFENILHAQTQCLPCSPLFHGQTGWAESFLFAGFGNWNSTNHKQKIPSQVYIASSKCMSLFVFC